MHRSLIVAVLAASALAAGAAAPSARARHVATPALAGGTTLASAGCPQGTLPDGDACVHLPSDEDEGEAKPSAENAHRRRSGEWQVYDQIPRRPDRPADYDAYRYPIPPGVPGGHSVLSGYDLDKPDPAQRRGARLHAVGHGGVDLPQARGTKIELVPLEHQQDDALVVYVGPLFGTTVVTRHTVREAGTLRDYLVLFGHLEAPAPGLHVGARLRDRDLVGLVGDTGSPELVHLHLEVRRLRDGIDPTKVAPARLVDNAVSVVCDPRNVLPLKN